MFEASSELFKSGLKKISRKPKNEFVIQLTGAGGVGKVSLINKYLGRAFNARYEKKKSSKEAFPKAIEGVEVMFSFCSRVGGDKKQELSQANAFMILVASDNKKTFDSIDDWQKFIHC